MVNYRPVLDATFSALSDPTRRAMLAMLTRGDCSVTELAKPFSMSLPAVSKHLRVLERAGLLARERDGRVHRCRLVAEPIKQAATFLETYRRFWEGRLDALARYLETTQDVGARPATAHRSSPQQEDSTWPPHKRTPKPPSASRARSTRRGSGSSARGRVRKK
ncbi:MAG: helix-turn-helix transcriptional regulator [Nitrospirae bacterium]|nr:helix-turn-helix transcriptional regulator [Nitrospirota bacterium]